MICDYLCPRGYLLITQAALKAMLLGTSAGSSFSSGGITTTIGFGQATSSKPAFAMSLSSSSSVQGVSSARAMSSTGVGGSSSALSTAKDAQSVDVSHHAGAENASAASGADGDSNQSNLSPAKKRIRLDAAAAAEAKPESSTAPPAQVDHSA